ncbi:asparaginase [Aerococcus sp. UMB8608]|uniref:asparaginase n=1 Tax=Aerococcus sp. UMB8608 TaxID=3046347 RepID=UPI0025513A45|nr:asparaginase [Aerococcus sp. UMB8608]MDK6679864.1 asparaginase [Aerococcus sp. UMB8608]
MTKHIHVIGTGGTISAAGDSGKTTSYQAGAFDASQLLEGLPPLDGIADLTYEQIFSVASESLTNAQLLQLGQRVQEILADDAVDGVVVSHGTDTLEETAYFLHLTAPSDKTLVLTGAMRPATASSADGPMNLYQAICLATSEQAVGMGALVVFSDGIYAGREVQKTSNFRPQAFDSRDLGCLGYLREDQAYFLQGPTKASPQFDLSGVARLPRVDIAYYHVGASADILDFFKDRSDGIVLAGVGTGNISQDWASYIKSHEGQLPPIVRSSRVGNGLTLYEASVDEGMPFIPSGSLPPSKAKILLSLVLTQTQDPQAIREAFEKY